MAITKTLPSSRLLVPVHLDALVVNSKNELDKTKWKDISLNISNLMKYSSLRGLGSSLERSIPKSGGKNTSRTKEDGVHLHWVLPKAFRHGVFNRLDNSWEYPLVPNRWLVVRSDRQLNLKSWIVESDYIEANATKDYNWIQHSEITNNGNPLTYKFTPIKLGRVTELADWKEQATDPMFLTIMAPGNPEFASSYLHCKNVFGFHDDMNDVDPDTVFTYRIYGWYSDAKNDPLAEVQNMEDLNEKLTGFSWKYDTTVTPVKDVPNGVLCHAIIHSVKWSTRVKSKVPSISNIKLGIGNSTSEALAALLQANVSGDQMDLPPKLLAAFQYKCLENNGLQDNWTSAMEQQMHRSGFTAASGGTNWVIEPKEKEQENNHSQTKVENTKPLSNSISDLLVKLNKLQNEYDIKRDKLKSYQAQLYASKYKKVFAFTISARIDNISDSVWSDIDKTITDGIKAITELKREIVKLKMKRPNLTPDEMQSDLLSTYTGEIIDVYNNLLKAIEADDDLKDFQLIETLMPGFYETRDPAIVIDGLNPSEKYTASNTIKCRTLDQIADQITIPFDGHYYTIKSVDLYPKAFSMGPTEASDLFLESLLLDPNSTDAFARAVKDKSGSSETLTSIADIISGLEVQVERFSRNDGQPVVLPETFSVVSWEQPWIPLYMEWEVNWKGTYEDFSSDSVFEKWNFGDSGSSSDFTLNLSGSGLSSKIVKYRGRTILTHDLVDKVSELEKKLDTDLFRTMKPMSQQLSGLNNQLIMRDSGIELPILNKELETDDDLPLIDDEYPWHPMPNEKAFFPFRGGVFHIHFLRVIDAFGQVLEIIDPKPPDGHKNPDIQSSHALPNHEFDGKEYFVLAPRIIQPARIRFDWLSANPLHKNRITDSDPATNPVCGWLLYNKLDHSISIFNSAGVELGELLDTGVSVTFVPPPGKGILPIENESLQQLVNSIKGNRNAFDGIINRIKKIALKVTPKVSQHQISMTLPVGNPVALVAARCVLELKNLPAQYQYWNTKAISEKYFDKIAVKTYLGDENSNQDGLLGFFLNENYGSLNLPNSHIPLSIESPVTLSLLMDPRMSIQLSCGILPAEKYVLPQHMILSSLQAINLRFLVAPLLTPISSLELPLPKISGSKWNWTSMEGEKVVQQKPESTLPRSLNYPPLHSVEGWLTIKS